MDTIYYNLQAKKIKVSGGADLVTFVPTPVPAPAQGGGEVLDFSRCRRRLETKAAWRELSQTALQVPQAEEAQAPTEENLPQPAPSRRERASGWLELCASASVIAMCLAAVFAFLRLL